VGPRILFRREVISVGTDIRKVTYSDSWRPSLGFVTWVLDELDYPDSNIWYVPDYEEKIEELRAVCPPQFREELERLLRDYGGCDIAVG